MDPKLINYIKETDNAVSFYYSVQESKTGIKITFAVILFISCFFVVIPFHNYIH